MKIVKKKSQKEDKKTNTAQNNLFFSGD